MLRQSRLAQFYRDFLAKVLVLVNPTELEMFYQHLLAKALVLVNPTELEIFRQHLAAKAKCNKYLRLWRLVSFDDLDLLSF